MSRRPRKNLVKTLLACCGLSLSSTVRPPLHFLSSCFPFWFLSAISFFHSVFLYLYLSCFLCLSPSRGWCDEWDECKHMCGVYDGLLTGRSYLLCSAPVVLWLQLTAWILDKRADIKEYSGEEQSLSLSLPRTHVIAVGGGSDIRRFHWQSQARQVRLREFCGRLPLGKLWCHVSPHTSSHQCTFFCIPLFFYVYHKKLTASSCTAHWQHCSPCQRAIQFDIQYVIAIWEWVVISIQKPCQGSLMELWSRRHPSPELRRSEDKLNKLKHLIIEMRHTVFQHVKAIVTVRAHTPTFENVLRIAHFHLHIVILSAKMAETSKVRRLIF